MIVLKNVAGLMGNNVVNQRHWCHDQTPVQADASPRIATSPAFGLVNDFDNWCRDAKRLCDHSRTDGKMLDRMGSIPVPASAADSGALDGCMTICQHRRAER